MRAFEEDGLKSMGFRMMRTAAGLGQTRVTGALAGIAPAVRLEHETRQLPGPGPSSTSLL